MVAAFDRNIREECRAAHAANHFAMMNKSVMKKRLGFAGLFSLLALAALAVTIPNWNRAAEGEEEELGGPGEARAWRTLAWRNENGVIPPDGFQKATQQILALSRRQPMTPGLSGWKERGPYNVSGRARSLLIDPRDTNIMFMGSVSGGIWKSTDAGANWEPVSDRLPNLAITCLAFDPSNPDVMYAGTGEGFFNGDAIQGAGILMSSDAGANWNILPATTGFGNVNRVAVSPTNSNIILAGTQYGGVRRSTDGGASWNTTASAQLAHQVVFHPTDGTKALAAILDYDFVANTWYAKVMYSTNSGASFTDATGSRLNGFERIEVAYAPSNPTIVYANVSGSSGKVYKSTNGGQSFGNVTTSGVTNSSWYNNGIFVDPSDANKLILTGLHTYKSTNGGATITQISNGYIMTDDVHPDVHAAIPHPGFNGTSNTTFFVATDGGIFKTTSVYTASSSSGWAHLSKNARTTQFYGAAGDGPSGKIIGGTQDNGTLRLENGTNNAALPFGGDGGWCAIDPTNTNYVYGEYVHLLIWRHTNGGTTFGGNGNYIVTGLTEAGTSAANFIAPFIMDPNEPQRLLAGGSQLWRTNNAKAATAAAVVWTSIKPSVGSPISAIAVAEGNPNVIWVGHNDGRIYRTSNGTAVSPTWTTVDNNGGTNPLGNRYVGRILIDKANHDKVYVALGGFNADNLQVTTNAGVSFSSASGSGATALPSAPIRAIARHPNNANLLHVGTEVGICESSDGGATWTAPNKGPVNVSVDELNYMHNSTKLLAATHGRGLWIYGSVGVSSLGGPSTMTEGETKEMTVMLDGIAGGGGVDVSLSANNGSVTVPSTVNVPVGETTATFQVTANNVSGNTPVTVTATANGQSDTHVITVQDGGGGVNYLSDVALSKSAVAGGSLVAVKAKVVLSQPAPPGGLLVNLSSSHPSLVSVPSTITVLQGRSVASTVVTHSPAAVNTAVTITATRSGESVDGILTVQAPKPRSVTTSRLAITGGVDIVVTGTVTLNGPAPAGGTSLAVSSTLPGSANPVVSTVTVPAGSNSVTFGIDHFPVPAQRLPNIRATGNGVTKFAVFTVNPPLLDRLTLSTLTVKGGSATTVTGTVFLDGPAPSGGWKITLSDNSGATGVPANVTVPEGATQATFNITHSAVAVQTIVTITASKNGVVKTKDLTVKP